MTDLRTAAQQALEALEGGADSWQLVGPAIDALRAALAEPVLQTCNCRWDGEMQMQQCTLHEAHVDAIKEWAQRAKFAEKKLAALAEQRLTDMEQKMERSIESLKTALAEPGGGGNLPPPFPVKFDHAIGADRFKVVRGAFWWHVLIGDSPTEHGKFRSRASAEKMAADLLREFRNGAFVQHEAAMAEPVQEPVYWEVRCNAHPKWMRVDERQFDEYVSHGWEGQKLYTAPPQRKPLTEEEIDALALVNSYLAFARAIERAHGIT